MLRAIISACVLSTSISWADSIEILSDGKKHEGVCVIESATTYIVAEPTTGETWSVNKTDALITISDDRDDLLLKWKKMRDEKHPASSLEAAATAEPTTTMPSDTVEVQDKPIVIKHHGNDVPNPEAVQRAEAMRANVNRQKEQERAEALAIQAAAEEAAKRQAFRDTRRAQEISKHNLQLQRKAIENNRAATRIAKKRNPRANAIANGASSTVVIHKGKKGRK